MDSVAVVLLAAGSSRRMGKENKLLLPYRGRPMIAHQVTEIRKSNLKNVIVVLGHHAAEISEALPPFTKTIYNPNHLSGMTSSIRAGIEAVEDDVKGYMICLSDMPLLDQKDYEDISHFFQRHIDEYPRLIVQPVFKEQPGHPIVFSNYYRKEILEHTVLDGCREIIRNHKNEVLQLNMSASNILKDIDTPEDYRTMNEG